MVVIRPYETSSSTTYDVFLSFRGEDTRYTFTDHLYRALLQHGFRTFRDEDEMQKGERLKSELEKAIPQSKSSIIVISENYADSSWCLDELVMILERRRTSGHVVLPVFYHVAPSEVRKQTGTIAVAFEKHKKQCDEKTDTEGKRTWMEKIQGWRSALTEVADLIGHHHVDGGIESVQGWMGVLTQCAIYEKIMGIKLTKTSSTLSQIKLFNNLAPNSGTEAVKGLTFDVHMLKEAGNHGKKRKYEEFCDKSILSTCASSLKRRFLNFSYGQSVSTTITSQNDVYLRTDAFKSMRKLRLLLLNDVQLAGSFDNFPKGLVWLSWHRFPLKSIPIEFHLEKLVALDLSHSRLEQVWMETPFLGSLKILDLSYSERLARTPNFFGLQNLERLILKGCVSLVEVCESIGNLETLDLLDLQDCRTLRKLPRNIGKLGSLKTLIISGCNIGDFPSEMRNMQSLKVLEADGIFKNLLCISSEEVKWWERIVWPMVAKPRKGPETIWASLPCSLRKLSLARCNLSDESFPMNFVNLPSLSYLNLSYNPIRRLPNLIRSLSSTNCSLDVINCHRLRLLNFNGISITYFRIIAIGCKSLEIVAPLNRKVKFHHLDYYSIVELKDSFEDTTEYFSTNASCKNIQGTYGYGVYSIRLSGNRVPTFTGEKCEGSSSICFTVPFLPARRIKCLNAWCKAQLNYVPTYKIRLSVKIENKTKDLTWINIDDFYVHPELDKYVGWLSRWSLGNQLEAGDEIIITFEYNKIIEVIEECGYKIVYYDQEEEEEEETEKGNTSTIEKSPHHLPPLRLRRADAISVVIEEDPNKDY
ncbi:hypothetical protein LguiB_021495 [Lonicera macranthoides]